MRALVLLILAGCSSVPPAEYRETQEASPPERARSAPKSSFDNYSDDAADRWLNRRVADHIDAEIRATDAQRERREAERMRGQARQLRRREVYVPPYYRAYRRRYWRSSPMPWSTIYYGTLGAAIGGRDRRARRGLAIGASIGLMHDLMRWNW